MTRESSVASESEEAVTFSSNRFLSIIKHPVKTFRLAPLGSSVGILYAGVITGEAHLASNARSPELMGLEAGLLAMSGLIAALTSGGLISRQFSLRDRLQDSLSKHGYDARAFATTTDEWCNRQTARVVCAEHELLADYVALCNQREDTARLKFIPHI